MDYLEKYEKWLNSVDKDADLYAELAAVKGDAAAVRDRFGGELEFGTGGIRGVLGAGTNRMNVYVVRRAAYGMAKFIESLGEGAKKRGVAVSYDTRKYSFEFALASARVLAGAGIKAYLFENVRPVPMLSFAVRRLNAVCGIMITASHNPPEYNGFKAYGEDGAQLSPEACGVVYEYIKNTDVFDVKEAENADLIQIIGEKIDKAFYKEIEKASRFDTKKYKGGFKIVYTPLHGSGYIPVTTVFKRRGIYFIAVARQTEFDSAFPTVKTPNPENADALAMGIALAKEKGAKLVIGTDPDCDRMGIAVDDGEGGFALLNGNQTGALMLDYIIDAGIKKGTLPANAVFIKTIVTSSLGELIAKAKNVACENVLTGFKYIGEKIKQYEGGADKTYIFGYEESFGYLCHTACRDKDAVSASMLIAEMALYYDSVGSSLYKRLNELFAEYGYFIEKGISIEYKGLDGLKNMRAAIKAAEGKISGALGGLKILSKYDYNASVRTFGGGGTEKITLPKADVLYYELEGENWLCVRPSGTEPKLKIYLGCRGADKAAAEERVKALNKDIDDLFKAR